MAKIKTVDWDNIADEQLLQVRIRDLGVQIAGSEIEPRINQLYEELEVKGIKFRPPCYLADEWLCPDREPIIGIPFCLAHPRLKHIEQQMMLEVEGGTEQACMRLLRHETGHAINYAYEFFKKTQWRQLFGPMSTRYSDTYHYLPYSRRFVVHLESNYAQAHPDEDFSETFAVWLTPNSNWQEEYKDWPAIKKLLYVDNLMKKIAEVPALINPPNNPPWSASKMTSTLAAYYKRRRESLGNEFQAFYDDKLKTLFTSKPAPDSNKASKLLRRHRKKLVDNIAKWTGHRKYDISQLLDKLIVRCDVLELLAKDDDIIGAAALITTIADNTFKYVQRYD